MRLKNLASSLLVGLITLDLTGCATPAPASHPYNMPQATIDRLKAEASDAAVEIRGCTIGYALSHNNPRLTATEITMAATAACTEPGNRLYDIMYRLAIGMYYGLPNMAAHAQDEGNSTRAAVESDARNRALRALAEQP